jgi:hypothetical protein
LDGFNFFLLADLSPSTQCGILDIFWDKKWSTPEYFREFNSPTVITAQRPKSQEVFDLQPGASIFSEGGQLTLEWMVSHFQPSAVEKWHHSLANRRERKDVGRRPNRWRQRATLGFNLYVFQACVGQGKLLATGLNLANGNPEAVYLLDQIYPLRTFGKVRSARDI